MSGICGIVRFDEQAVENDDVKNILHHMHNSGNDAEGIWTESYVGLGHKMLWVTPESLSETQPLVNVDTPVVLTADARIDNREELFEQLNIAIEGDNVITDIDLIVKAYLKWGNACAEYLLGDFTFALWDVDKQELFCVRDPMGIRQFYYYHDDNYFVFASEIHSIVEGMHITKAPDVSALKNFMKTFSLPYESTFYQDIHRLPPAHTLTLTKGQKKFKRYWFPERIKIDKNLTFEEAKQKFDALFTQATDARMRSAYPVGSHLSGGLDSSSVTAEACTKHGKDALTAFSLHYGDLECDESKYSNALIEQYDLKAEVIRSDLLDYENIYTIDRYNGEDPDWPGAGLFMDEIPIMERAKELEIRVILTGQGGDHILSGNEYMLADYLKEGSISKFYEELKYYEFSKDIIKSYIVSPLLPEKIKNILRFLLRTKGNRQGTDNAILYNSCFFDMEEKINDLSSLAQEVDLRYTVGMGNAFWMSSGASLEGRYNIEYRHPFFDKRLIEFTLSLPSYMKMEKGVIKKLLRESMKSKLPSIIKDRQDKAVFSEVLKIQLDVLKVDHFHIYKIFELDIVKREDFEDKIETFRNGNLDGIMTLWNIILIENWLQNLFK